MATPNEATAQNREENFTPIHAIRPMFESAEHNLIGDHVMLRLPNDGSTWSEVNAGNQPLGSKVHGLTYGQVLALGGDFYGVPDQPISTAPDPGKAFLAAWKTFTDGDPNELQLILQIMQDEINAVRAGRAAGKSTSAVYDELGDSLSKRWNKATGGGGIASDWLPKGRYLLLAQNNFDHFGSGAVDAYIAGHNAALSLASTARSQRFPDAVETLKTAYGMNAFADHFLTDLFSAGHLRVPRKELHDQITALPYVGAVTPLGDLLARSMHDEDSKYGLNVQNRRGEKWICHGDKRLIDDGSNLDNYRRVITAVQASVYDVQAAYLDEAIPFPDDFPALLQIPDLDLLSNWDDRSNFSPLFINNGGTVQVRNNLGDRSDYSWTGTWTGPTTYAKLQALGMISGWVGE